MEEEISEQRPKIKWVPLEANPEVSYSNIKISFLLINDKDLEQG